MGYEIYRIRNLRLHATSFDIHQFLALWRQFIAIINDKVSVEGTTQRKNE